MRTNLRVAVTGAGGLIGTAVARSLEAEGHAVVRLVRREPRAEAAEIAWDPVRGRLDDRALDGVDAVVHLAGENIAGGRWTAGRRRAILDSRVQGTSLLAGRMAGAGRPGVLVCASAIGYYGDRGDGEVDEEAGPGQGFLAEVVSKWEAATAPAEAAGVRVVRCRLGMVLDPRGGALSRMLPLFRLGLGGRLGHGRQYWSWITLEDAARGLVRAVLDPGLRSPVNLVAPEPVTNARFTTALGRALGRPALLAVPGPFLRLVLGRMADELLLASTRVRPVRLLRLDHHFVHPRLDAALATLLAER